EGAAKACRPVATILAADEHQAARCSERAAQAPERRVAPDIEDEVVLYRAIGKIAGQVVDDVVGAQAVHQRELASAGHARDLGTQRLGELHGVATHTAGSADD